MSEQWRELTWRGAMEGETFFEGSLFTPDGAEPHPIAGIQQYREVCFASGAIALVHSRADKNGAVWETMDAVKIPGKRGYRLFVNGKSHYKKWGRTCKGIGLVWAGRKTWNKDHAEAALWDMCREKPRYWKGL